MKEDNRHDAEADVSRVEIKLSSKLLFQLNVFGQNLNNFYTELLTSSM
jgi:hypothetical protein